MIKKLLPTIILVAVCVAGFVYAKSENFFREEEKQPQKLAEVAAGDAVSFSLKTESGEVALEKDGDAWRMTKPSAIPVDQTSVESWLNAFGEVAFDSVIEENPAYIAKFGLKEPKSVYEVKLSGGSKQILVGDELPSGGSRYVMAGGDPKVYKVSASALQPLKKTSLDFMNKKALDFNYAQLKSVKFVWKGETNTLTKVDAAKSPYESDWKLNGKTLKASDADPVLNKFLFLETQQLVKPASEVRTLPVDLEIEIVTEADGKETAQTYWGKIEGESVWIVRKDGEWAYNVPAADVQAILDAAKEKMQDPSPSPSASPTPSPFK